MNKLNLLLVIATFGFAFTSCAPEEGCTDPKSLSYNADADEDDGSCLYEGSVVFWFDANTSIFLQDNYINALKVFVNDSLIGIISSTSSYLIAPNCNEGGVTYYTDMGSNDTELINFTIKSPPYFPEGEDYLYTSGTLTMKGGECVQYKIQ